MGTQQTAQITATSANAVNATLTMTPGGICVNSLLLNVDIIDLLSGNDTQIGQVAIPANQSTGTVGVTLANLPTLIGSVVRAVVGPCGVNATISLDVPVLGSLTVPASLTLGQNGTGTVTISHAAPQGGVSVNLSKTPLGVVGDALNALLGNVVIPSSVTIAEGQTSANFSVTSSVVGGLVALLLPSSTNVQVDAVLQTAFTASSLSDIMQVLK